MTGNPSTSTEEVCLVCNDVSSGYHYGIPSCNGCKTFFRRTITKNQTFKCQYDGNCPVDKSIRCACRYCRFEKCLQVGMDRKAIQQSRDPIGYTKRTRRYQSQPRKTESSDDGLPTELPKPTHFDETDFRFLKQLADVELMCCRLLRSSYGYDENMPLETALSFPSVLRDTARMNSFSEPAPGHELGPLRPATNCDFRYWQVREMMVLVEWAKYLPIFQRLPMSDKYALLKQNGMAHPSLSQAYWTAHPDPEIIVFPSGAFFDRTPDSTRPIGFNKKKIQMLDQLLKPLRNLSVDVTEFAAFKAIIFLNPFIDDLSDESRILISDERGRITEALYRCMSGKHGEVKSGDRFGNLLLLGTVMAAMAVELQEAVLVADFFQQIKFTTFTKQLLFGVEENQHQTQLM